MEAKKLLQKRRARRKMRNKKKLFGMEERPRVAVSKSNRYIFLQVINDKTGKTLFGHRINKGITNIEKSSVHLIDELKKNKITSIVFDRGINKYHGNVKALAEVLRKSGFEF